MYFGLLYFTNFHIVSNNKTINNIEVFSNKSNKVSDLFVKKFVDNFFTKSVFYLFHLNILTKYLLQLIKFS